MIPVNHCFLPGLVKWPGLELPGIVLTGDMLGRWLHMIIIKQNTPNVQCQKKFFMPTAYRLEVGDSLREGSLNV